MQLQGLFQPKQADRAEFSTQTPALLGDGDPIFIKSFESSYENL